MEISFRTFQLLRLEIISFCVLCHHHHHHHQLHGHRPPAWRLHTDDGGRSHDKPPLLLHYLDHVFRGLRFLLLLLLLLLMSLNMFLLLLWMFIWIYYLTEASISASIRTPKLFYPRNVPQARNFYFFTCSTIFR